MAALAASAVSDYPTDLSRRFYPDKGNRQVIQKTLKLVLTGQGDQTDTIGAAALGFSKLISCSNLFDDSNNKVYPAVVDPVTNIIILADGAAAPAPVAVTAAATYITVVGSPTL